MKKAVINNIPNFITCLRILGTICLWFIEPFSATFFVVYTLAGVSDALDGIIARAMKTTSELGTKLDSIADIMFYFTMTIRVFPVLWEALPVWLWYGVGIILAVRIVSYALAAIKYHRFATLHTYMNKIAGFMWFTVPYAISMNWTVGMCTALLVVSAIGSVEELLMHMTRKEYRSNVKSIVVED